MERKILYFERTGPENTTAALVAARDRMRELGVKTLVVASSHGGTARKALEVFAGSDVKIVAVTICAGFTSEGWTMDPETRADLQAKGITVVTGLHALGDDVGAGFGERTPSMIVAETLYRFCQGMKVAVEVALMAADAGVIPMDAEIAALGGTSEGADTAIIVKPAYPRKFRELRIREILAMPRPS